MSRCVEKWRSAICPAMNGAARAPIEPEMPRSQPSWYWLKPSPPSSTLARMNMPASGAHSPNMPHWRNIMIERRSVSSLG